MTQAPAGWYPQQDGSQRYWDGSIWTEHHHPAPSASVVPVHAAAVAPVAVHPAAVHHGYPVVAVQPKNPGLSLVASLLITGLGQMINGEVGKGLAFFFGQMVLGVLTFILSFILIGLIGIPIMIGVWIWCLVDAYQGAQKWNAAHGIRS